MIEEVHLKILPFTNKGYKLNHLKFLEIYKLTKRVNKKTLISQLALEFSPNLQHFQ